MRVVHVSNTSEKNILGVDRHILNLAVAQKKRRHAVFVVADRPGVFTEACEKRGIPVMGIQELRGETRPDERTSASTARGLMDQFSRFDADLIHCHTPSALRQVIPASIRNRTPLIFSVHAKHIASQALSAHRAGLKFATIAVSRDVFEMLKKDGMPETKMYYVPNGIGTASAEPTHKTNGSHRPNLIFVGTPVTLKGIDVAIMAMAVLRQRLGISCPVLDIYGSDDSVYGYEGQVRYFKEMVDVLGLNNIVRFRGMRLGILESCSSANILVLPSRAETAPLVVLEAMSRGMPVVATDVGDIAEIIPDRRYGQIIPVNSIVALADAVEAILADVAEGRFDPNDSIERHHSFYTSDKMFERVEMVYKAVLDNV